MYAGSAGGSGLGLNLHVSSMDSSHLLDSIHPLDCVGYLEKMKNN